MTTSRRERSHSLWWGSLGTSVLVALSGCSGGAQGSEALDVKVILASSNPTIELPLDPYQLRSDELALIDNASDVLVAQCMKDRGFEFTPAVRRSYGDLGNSRRYGISSLDDATSIGYGAEELSNAGDILDQQRSASLSSEAIIALNGDGSGSGCRQSAYAQLAGVTELQKLQGSVDAAARISSATWESSRQDKRVSRAIDAWSKCMSRAGYSYASPLDAMADKRWSQGSTNQSEDGQATLSAGEDELRTARADVACKDEVNLLGVWASVEADLQKDQLEENQGVLAEVASTKAAALASAARVLAET